MILWSSLGWEEEITNKQQAKEIVKDAIADYKQQKITLSCVEDGQQKDKVIYNGLDEEKQNSWLDMIKRARELD